MVSDDLTALAAISMGAIASAAVTFALTTHEPDALGGVQAEAPSVGLVGPCDAFSPIVDFAIIRADLGNTDVQTMVGPEGRHSGWEAGSLEMRLLRSR